jgi:UDP-3-O-[3-hydroxymyristoyl] glucosamine N-acyltransferase
MDKPRDGIRIADLAAQIGATLDGDGEVVVSRVATLEHAGPDAVSFLTQPRFRPLLATTRAGAVIVSPVDANATRLPKLVHANPYAAYAKASTLLNPAPVMQPGIDLTARIGQGATVEASACVGAYAVIGARARIGARAFIGAHSVVGDGCEIGDDAYLHPRVSLYTRSVIGARTIVHSGAVIGADGFGMAEEDGRWIKIPQLGRVLIGADCEIGANTTIDRGAIDDTVIEDDVKLDNQIQIGHNCRIGTHTAIAGCTGIAGSVTIGRNVRIAGAVNVSGHLTIPDGTVIMGAATVFGTLEKAGVYAGAFPLMPYDEWRRAAATVRRLRALGRRIADIERALRAQDGKEGDAS